MAQPSAMTLKRIHREIADLRKEDLGDITLTPFEDSLYFFKGTIPGPTGSVYEGGVFDIDMQLLHDYPFSAPKVMFKTRIYHMNISEKGGICIDILKNNWSPALSLYKVMLSLSSLLTDPNPQDPLVPTIANQYIKNRQLHDSTARRWTELYAKPKPPPPMPVVVSSKASGKRKAAPATESTTITIEDSDTEEPASSSNKRRRPSRRASVIELDSEPEGTGPRRKPVKKRGQAETAGSSSRNTRNRGDVIDITDD
ncbi:ubiquitin-conjugating enzyme/RWD-like protein [Mycena floridula]|nr:ubiquitin-conjugating enzyme/RWD-like protein [Mycena floridula]